MPAPFRPISPAALALGASALALTVSACKVDSRPLLARGQPAYAAADPVAYPYAGDLDLPYAQPAQLMPVREPYDGYALAERAYAYDRAAYRAPPDYGFRYGDEDPWAWQLADESLMFAEPYGDDYRFYYYEPGAARPYFVRDPYYGYGYGENGALLAVFDAAGALLPDSQLSQLAAVAGRYLARGSDLRDVYYGAPRYTVDDRVWIDRAPLIYAEQQPWIEAAESYPEWRRYRASSGERFLTAFEPDRVRRQRIAERYERRIDWDAAKAVREARREQAKDVRKLQQARAKDERRIVREQAKAERRSEHVQARAASDAARPAAARVEDRPGRGREEHLRPDRPRAERHGPSADRPDRGDRGPRIARNDAPGPQAQRGDDRGADRGKRHDDARGGGKPDRGHGGGPDHGGGHGKGKP